MKEKIKKLKSQKAKLEELNMQLQEQALQHDHSTLLSNAELKANEKVLKKLQKRLNGAHSDDKVDLHKKISLYLFSFLNIYFDSLWYHKMVHYFIFIDGIRF